MKIFSNTVEVYPDEAGEWRWSLRNVNTGFITADGGEGYSSASNARRAARSAGRALALATIKTVKRSFQSRRVGGNDA